MTDWSPEQYHRFREQRRQPWVDLASMVRARPSMNVIDLGCGSGELTRALHSQLGAATTLGIDSSEAMLALAAQHAGDGVSFRGERIESLGTAPGRVDLVFSNAALHWVDDHEALLGRLATLLGPEGQIAIQVPGNHDHPASFVADEVGRHSDFAEELGGFQQGVRVLEPRAYAEILDRLGFAEQQVVLRIYGHHLPSRDGVVEWVKGALLTAFEKRLSAESFTRFCQRYKERLFEEIPDARPYFFTYRRILMWAQRAPA